MRVVHPFLHNGFRPCLGHGPWRQDPLRCATPFLSPASLVQFPRGRMVLRRQPPCKRAVFRNRRGASSSAFAVAALVGGWALLGAEGGLKGPSQQNIAAA